MPTLILAIRVTGENLTPFRGLVVAAFAIIELDDGFEIIEVMAGQSPEDAAFAAGGELADPGPYASYEEAADAIDQLEILDERE